MAQGSWLMPQGSWLEAHGSWPRKIGARARASGTNFSWPWALSHESWGMSHGLWEMSHEPVTINNRLINEWYVVSSKNSTNFKIQTMHYWPNKIEIRMFYHYIENQVHKVMLVTWLLTFEKNAWIEFHPFGNALLLCDICWTAFIGDLRTVEYKHWGLGQFWTIKINLPKQIRLVI